MASTKSISSPGRVLASVTTIRRIGTVECSAKDETRGSSLSLNKSSVVLLLDCLMFTKIKPRVTWFGFSDTTASGFTNSVALLESEGSQKRAVTKNVNIVFFDWSFFVCKAKVISRFAKWRLLQATVKLLSLIFHWFLFCFYIPSLFGEFISSHFIISNL